MTKTNSAEIILKITHYTTTDQTRKENVRVPTGSL